LQLTTKVRELYYRAIGTAGAWTLGASAPEPSLSFGGQPLGCSWATQVVDSDTTIGDQIQIAVDSSGVPHISKDLVRALRFADRFETIRLGKGQLGTSSLATSHN
jgi:hypothetical protein